jgi:precorrin-8X/cobalt-precorrin-8 methylmutase
MTLFDAFVMVDWSAANVAGPAAGGANGIWVAVGDGDAPAVVTPHPTRRMAMAAITAELLHMVDEGRRVLVGFDFVYGYPSGTAAAAGLLDGQPDGQPPWRVLWEHLRRTITDDERNRSNRFEVAADLNGRMGRGPGPFWGVPAGRPADPRLLPTKPRYPYIAHQGGSRGSLPEWRAIERAQRAAGHQPKSPWQLLGAGSVGSQALVGIPHLARLRSHPALEAVSAVWPFETGFTDDPAQGRAPAVVYVEVYPSLLTPDEALHPVRDARQVLALVAAYRGMDRAGTLSTSFTAPGTSAAERRAALAEEGWVLHVERMCG